MKKKVLAALLALCLSLSLLPYAVSADGEAPKLAAPAEPVWGEGCAVCWTVPESTQNLYEFKLYLKGQNEPLYAIRNQESPGQQTIRHNYFAVNIEYMSEGTYYFTVQSIGDGVNYSSSEISKSGELVYTMPETVLRPATEVAWDFPYISWTPSPDEENIAFYIANFYFSKTADGEPERISSGYNATVGLRDELLRQYGEGYYYAAIYGVSSDVREYRNTPLTQCSAAYHYTGTGEPVKLAAPRAYWGDNRSTCWEMALPTQGNYEYKLYRAGVSAPVMTMSPSYKGQSGGMAVNHYFSVNSGDLAEGTYYFTVQSIGDGINYLSSEISTSGELVYARPETVLRPATDVVWDFPHIKWTQSPDEDNINFYIANFYFSKTKDGEPQLIGSGFNADVGLREQLTERYGEGYYYASIYGISKDVLQFQNTPLSELSQAYHFTGSEPSRPVNPPQSSGGGSSGGRTSFVVSVPPVSGGSINVSPENASAGTEVIITVKADSGYRLDTLTVYGGGKLVELSEKGDGRFSFIMPASKADISAAFAKIEASAPPFGDVSEGDWYFDAVKYAYDKGLMTGVSGQSFAPGADTSRAMLVTILYRLENEPEAGACAFSDAAGQWYSDAVAWAAAKGIVNGYSSERFGPNEALTREQLASILYRYTQYKGRSVTQRSSELDGYQDFSLVSAYAAEAVSWAHAVGLIQGTDAATLSPSGHASRAQTAQILMRFCESIGK